MQIRLKIDNVESYEDEALADFIAKVIDCIVNFSNKEKDCIDRSHAVLLRRQFRALLDCFIDKEFPY